MLTKEQCEQALESLSNPPYESSCGGCICGVSDCGDCPNNKANKVLNQLIDEHFSNPPFGFEELKPNMWVWDDIDKEYRKVYGKGIYLGDEYLMKTGCKVVFISEDEYFNLIYEPNRFYRKEVKDV